MVQSRMMYGILTRGVIIIELKIYKNDLLG